MTKLNFKFKRPELSIAEVLDQYECTVDDLFHAAAEGELTIYVSANEWRSKFIISINEQLMVSKIREDLAQLQTQLQSDPSSSNNVMEDYENRKEKTGKLFNEVLSADSLLEPKTDGYFTLYPNNGIYRALYLMPLKGLQPISRISLSEFRNGSTTRRIELNLFDNSILVDNDLKYIVFPDHDVLFQDALRDGKLFVMKKDLQAMSGQPTNPDDVKPEGGVSRKTLLKLVLGMAMNRYNFDPTKTRTDVPKTIEIGVTPHGIDLTDDTIRKALKEAVDTIPRKPA